LIAGVEHVAISVSSLERSIDFYRDLLGLSLARILECGPDSPLPRITAQPGCEARIAHLYTGSFLVELFEYRAPRGRTVEPDRRQADLGLVHLGLRSTDARADFRRLKQSGVETLSDPVEFRPGVWLFYFRGPDGEVLELRET
jgi:glyoxylase I family protein